MDQSAILNITAKSLILVLYLSLPPILVATLVGVLVSLIQALTQVQEQTLSFAIKLIVVIMVLLFTMDWAGRELLAFADGIFDLIPTVRR
jgi:type III secretion HrpO family protein